MAVRLSGPDIERLVYLFRDAFSRERFTDLLLYRLDRRIDDYVGANDDYPTSIRKVVQEANRVLWWQDLVRAARNVVPGDSGLVEFGGRFGISPRFVARVDDAERPIEGRQLELKIRETGTTFDIAPWLRRIGEIEARVCRIEYPEQTDQATGFLVGPDLVLTNYHVVGPIIDEPAIAETVALRFDYKVADDGVAVQPGVVYKLAQPSWLEHSSPYADADSDVEQAADAPADQLDFAFLRVDGRPGEDPVGGPTRDPTSTPRGWIRPPVQDYDFSRSPSLAIVQHPDGRPMRIALDTEAVLGLNDSGTRVRYATTTEPGSSGSPCFGPNWEWVALHHMGDPRFALHGARPEFNQGIPVTAIRTLLSAQGKARLLAS
jgi:Trypsin-like peptidase domain/Effector-associated domain 1